MKKVDWAVPQRSKRLSRSVEYRRTYDKLSASYISLGEAFLGRMLKLIQRSERRGEGDRRRCPGGGAASPVRQLRPPRIRG
jgi:hypothetical protein